MAKCCGEEADPKPGDPCCPPEPECSSAEKDAAGDESCPLTWFDSMIPHCLEYAEARHAEGRPVVGIMCEYAPREIIMAAGGVPVCLCGGSAKTIPAAEEDLPSTCVR